MGLLKDSTLTFGSRIVAMLLNIGVVSATARLLGPEGRGIFAIYMVMTSFFALLSSVGLEMACAYYAGMKKYNVYQIFSSLNIVILISTLLSIIGICVIWQVQPDFARNLSLYGMILTVFYVPFFLSYNAFWYIHTALGNRRYYCWGGVVSVGLTLFFVLLFCWNNATPERMLLGYLLGLILASAYLNLGYIKLRDIFHLELSWACVKDVYKYGVKYYFARMGQFLNIQIGTMVIAFIASAKDTGLFSTAIGLVARLTIIPEVITTVLLSHIVREQQDSIHLTAKAVRYVFWIVTFASLMLAIFVKPVVYILFSSKFMDITVPILILLPGVLVRSCSKTLGVYFNGIGRPEYGSYAIFSAVVVNIIFMVLLLPLFGLSGAALAATLGYLVDACVLLICYKYFMKGSLALLVPRIRDLSELRSLMKRLIFREQARMTV